MPVLSLPNELQQAVKLIHTLEQAQDICDENDYQTIGSILEKLIKCIRIELTINRISKECQVIKVAYDGFEITDDGLDSLLIAKARIKTLYNAVNLNMNYHMSSLEFTLRTDLLSPAYQNFNFKGIAYAMSRS